MVTAPLIATAIASSLVLLSIFGYLYGVHRERYLAYWSLYWAFTAIRLSLALAAVDAPLSRYLPLRELLALAGATVMLLGALALAGRRMSLAWSLLVAACGTWIFVADAMGLGFTAGAVPTYTFLGLALIWSGVLVAQSSEVPGPEKYVAGGSLVLGGLHQADFPYLRPIESVAPWGYALSIAVRILVGTTLLLLFFKKSRQAEAFSNLRFDNLFERARDAILMVGRGSGVIIQANPAAQRLLGFQPGELSGRSLASLIGPDGVTADDLLSAVAGPHKGWSGALALRERTGRRIQGEASASLVEAEAATQVLVIFRDLSERRALEEQLRQAQKMEAVGQLAGGVAHDFNNILTVIGGYADLLASDPELPDSARAGAAEIATAHDRAASLTRQLLAFARRQVLHPAVINLNDVVVGMEVFLPRLIGEHIQFDVDLEPDLPPVLADPGQMEQVLVNLAVNARDAMPTGGRLTVTTQAVELGPEKVGSSQLPGDYVRLAVRDTGRGMDDQTRLRIFEPFFTTKAAGEGTGLGLSTVHGIVEQSGGYIVAESEIGRGTDVSVYLPVSEGPVEEVEEGPRSGDWGGSETVLVAEDDVGIRQLVSATLEGLGYRVLLADNGTAGLETATRHDGVIDLVISDVVMPRLGGPAMVERIRERHPGIRVLFITGYGWDALGAADEEAPLLKKPFTPKVLGQRVRQVLDGPNGPGSDPGR